MREWTENMMLMSLIRTEKLDRSTNTLIMSPSQKLKMTYVFKIQPLFIHQQNLSSITRRAMNTQSCLIYIYLSIYWLPRWHSGKEPACQCRRHRFNSRHRSGRSPGERNGYSLQYSCLENSMDRGAWWLQSIGLRRVGNNWETRHTHTHMHVCAHTHTHIHMQWNTTQLLKMNEIMQEQHGWT